MDGEILIDDKKIESVADLLMAKYQSGEPLYNQILCPNGEIAHKAMAAFDKRLIADEKLKENIILRVSADRLEEITQQPQYKYLLDMGLKNVFALCCAATIIDNCERLGLPQAFITDHLKGKPDFLYANAIVRLFSDAVNTNPDLKEAVLIFGDYIDTIEKAENLDLDPGILPHDISRNLWSEIEEPKKLIMIGFTRPNETTMGVLKKVNQTNNGFYNDIAYLGQTRIQSLF